MQPIKLGDNERTALMKLNAMRLGSVDLVQVAGEIDITTVEQVEEFFSTLEVSRLVIDLTAVTFMDTSGIHFLIRLLNQVTADKGKLTLVIAPNSSVQLLIKLTGLSDQFNIIESYDVVVGGETADLL